MLFDIKKYETFIYHGFHYLLAPTIELECTPTIELECTGIAPRNGDRSEPLSIKRSPFAKQ